MRILRLLFVLNCINIYSQNDNLITIGFERNIDLWQPYTSASQQYLQSGGKIESSSWSLYAQYRVLQKNKFDLLVGVSRRKINYRVVDRIKQYTFHYSTKYGGYKETHEYKDPADLVCSTKSLGINLETSYKVFSNKLVSGRIGLNSEIYFLESFKASYISSDTVVGNANGEHISPLPEMDQNPRLFFLASSNISVFYRTTFIINPNFSAAFKVSLGTNLSSDWDEYKKYAWLGLGVEVGFGKKKDKTKPE